MSVKLNSIKTFKLPLKCSLASSAVMKNYIVNYSFNSIHLFLLMEFRFGQVGLKKVKFAPLNIVKKHPR